MRFILFIISGLVFLPSLQIHGQDVYRRFLDYRRIVDLKAYYSKNQTPGLHAKYLGFRATYVRNILFLDGDGISEPDIGISLNPSISIAKFQYDMGEVRNLLLQEGMINFVPSLYLAVLPESGSRFTLFADIAGGVKLYNKLADIDTSIGSDTDDDWGVFDQWVFGLGAGIDFDKKMSLHFNYYRGWHDVTKSTQEYYRNYINTESNSTFISYFSVQSNFKLTDELYVSLEWDGYKDSFEDESILRLGLAWQTARRQPKQKFGNRSQYSVKSEPRMEHEELEVLNLESMLNELQAEFEDYKGNYSGVDTLEFTKLLNRMQNELHNIDRRRQLNRWLRKLEALKKQLRREDAIYSKEKLERRVKRSLRKEK